MQEKKSKIFEFEYATVEVVYSRLPEKKDLEKACAQFLRKVDQERKTERTEIRYKEQNIG